MGQGLGLLFKAHRLVYHSTLGSRVIKKKKDLWRAVCADASPPASCFMLHVSYFMLQASCSSLQASGFMLQGSGFRVQGSGFRVPGSEFRVQGSDFRVPGSGVRVQGSGFRVQGSGFRVPGSGFRVLGSGFRVPGSGFRVQGSAPDAAQGRSTKLMSMIKWIRTSRLSIKNSLSPPAPDVGVFAVADVLELHGLEKLRRQGHAVPERTCQRESSLLTIY